MDQATQTVYSELFVTCPPTTSAEFARRSPSAAGIASWGGALGSGSVSQPALTTSPAAPPLPIPTPAGAIALSSPHGFASRAASQEGGVFVDGASLPPRRGSPPAYEAPGFSGFASMPVYAGGGYSVQATGPVDADNAAHLSAFYHSLTAAAASLPGSSAAGGSGGGGGAQRLALQRPTPAPAAQLALDGAYPVPALTQASLATSPRCVGTTKRGRSRQTTAVLTRSAPARCCWHCRLSLKTPRHVNGGASSPASAPGSPIPTQRRPLRGGSASTQHSRMGSARAPGTPAPGGAGLSGWAHDSLEDATGAADGLLQQAGRQLEQEGEEEDERGRHEGGVAQESQGLSLTADGAGAAVDEGGAPPDRAGGVGAVTPPRMVWAGQGVREWDWQAGVGHLVPSAACLSLQETMDLIADVYRAKVGPCARTPALPRVPARGEL